MSVMNGKPAVMESSRCVALVAPGVTTLIVPIIKDWKRLNENSYAGIRRYWTF